MGVNAGLVTLLALVPARSLPVPQQTAIEVTLVEPDAPEPEPEPDPVEPEPETADVPEDPAPALPQPEIAAVGPEAESLPEPGPQSPVTALPGETADAAPLTGRRNDIPEIDLPVFAEPEARQRAATETALRGLACNRLGRERPGWCDEAVADVIDGPEPPAFAEQPVMAPKEWAAFELPEREEWCGQSDGVIRDVFVADSNPYRQGAAGAVGTLATDSLSAPCPD